MSFLGNLKLFCAFLLAIFFISQSQALPFKLGIMTEPGFEYISIEDIDEARKGFNIPFQVQALFQEGAVNPFFSVGYNYTDVWFSKTYAGHTFVSGFSNHSLSLEAGLSFVMTNSLSFDPFITYYSDFSPEQYRKIDDKDVDKSPAELDYYRKLRLGGRFFYSIDQDFDLGFGGAFVLGFIRPKDISDFNQFKGFQLNVSLRKRFDL
jgi:hypothetical protein